MADSETKTKRGGWPELWGLTRRYRGRMALLGIASFVGAMLEASFLVLLTSALLALASRTTVIGPYMGMTVSTSTALGVAAATVALRLMLNLVTVHVSASLSAFVRNEQRERVARAYLRADWSVQQGEAAGKLQELLMSFVGRYNAAMGALTQAITSSLSLLAFLSAGVLIDPISTVAVLGALAVLGMALTPIRRRIQRHAGASAKADLAFATAIAELGSLGQEMQTFGVRDQFEARLEHTIHATTEQQRRIAVLSGSLSPLYTFLAYAAVIGGVAVLQLLGVGELAAVGSIMLLMLRSLSYGQQLLSVSGALAAALPSLDQVDDAVAHYSSRLADDGRTTPSAVTPLTLVGVSFGYDPDRPALEDVDLTIASGEMVGVIGPSGAGKSTLAQLLLGLRRPTGGHITVGGVDLREVDRGWWTRRVAFVSQDPILFTGTVADNIRFFRDGFSQSDLQRALEQAHVWSDVEALPYGLETHLGERGSQLSGGQRQRLSIARALVGTPELLILDEPTSALDGQSELLIRDTLAGLHGRVTIVIIAHRMSTLELCDRIMVIENGRVSAFDAPVRLRGSSEFFRKALAVAGIA